MIKMIVIDSKRALVGKLEDFIRENVCTIEAREQLKVEPGNSLIVFQDESCLEMPDEIAHKMVMAYEAGGSISIDTSGELVEVTVMAAQAPEAQKGARYEM